VKTWILACGLLLIISSPITGLLLARSIRNAEASANWPSVEGKVTRAEVLEFSRGQEPRYRASVSYQYRVNGMTFVGSRLQPIDRESDKPWPIVEALGGISAGKHVRVYYEPNHPAESLLKPGTITQDYFLVAIPFILLAFGIGVLALLYINERRA
jgi:hypothetical protein